MDQKNQTTQGLVCNGCGRQQHQKQGIPVEEFLDVTKTWGYFSRKDGLTQHFCLCEDCYDRMIAAFVRRPETRQETEYFPPVFAEECID